jgi:hypothetical protein
MRYAFCSAFERLARFEPNRHAPVASEIDNLLHPRPRRPFRNQNLIQRPARAQRFPYRMHSS